MALRLQAELLCTLGLPLSWAGGPVGPRQLPLLAPFSPCVPRLLRLVRGYAPFPPFPPLPYSTITAAADGGPPF